MTNPDRFRAVWLVEFKHSLGWCPFAFGPRRSEAIRELRKWRAEWPNYAYRLARYVPDAKLSKPKPAKKRARRGGKR